MSVIPDSAISDEDEMSLEELLTLDDGAEEQAEYRRIVKILLANSHGMLPALVASQADLAMPVVLSRLQALVGAGHVRQRAGNLYQVTPLGSQEYGS